MYLASAGQTSEIDRLTIEQYKTDGRLLMENAGLAVAKAAAEYGDVTYTVIVGGGNNGGDGSVAARHLYSMGHKVRLMLINPPEEPAADARAAYDAAVSFGVPIICGIDEDIILNSGVIIDAILGIGIAGTVRKTAEHAIKLINMSEARVVSVDIPSGVNSDTGQVMGCAVNADVTVTFGFWKLGHALYPGHGIAGKIITAPIGFSPEAIKRVGFAARTVDCLTLPEISDADYKGKRGKCTVVAGSERYAGAAVLCSSAALRAGSGLVNLIIPNNALCNLSNKLPEIITVPYIDGHTDIAAEICGSNSVVVGCGLTVSEQSKGLVADVLQNAHCPIVLDADGINCVAENKELLKKRACDVIITPHIGEMAHFLGVPASEVSADPVKIAQSAASEYNITVVLKSASTVIADSDGSVYINCGGNGGMATAGSGDVLAGIIGGFAAQGMSPLYSAVNGVAAHSLAGKKAAEKYGKHYMSASNITEELKKGE